MELYFRCSLYVICGLWCGLCLELVEVVAAGLNYGICVLVWIGLFCCVWDCFVVLYALDQLCVCVCGMVIVNKELPDFSVYLKVYS